MTRAATPANLRIVMVRIAAGALALLALTECGLWLASWTRPRLTVDVGPATGPYLSGFSPSVEFPPVTARWVQGDGRIALPLDVLPGSGTVWMHVVAGPNASVPTTLDVKLADRAVAQLDVGPTSPARQAVLPGQAPNDPLRDTRTYGLPVVTAGGPFAIELTASTQAIAIDWVRLQGLRYRVPWRALAPRLIGVGLFALGLVYALAWRHAFAAGLAGVALVAGCAAIDPFLCVHLAAKVAVPGLALSLVLALALRGRSYGPALGFLLLAGYVLKGAGLFHPGLHAPDALVHNRYVAAFRDAPGALADRGVAAQARAGVGYPRFIAGRPYVMPYSPVFYLPFVLLPPDRVVGAMKYAVLLASVAQTALLFALARSLLGSDRAALCAALLHTFAPPPFHRLVWAMWPGTAGHLADLLALSALLFWMRRPESRLRYGLLASMVLLSFVTYVSGIVLVATLLAAAAMLEGRRAWRLLLVAAAAGLVSVAFVYRPFTVVLFREILPALRAGGTSALGEHAIDPWTALARVPLFYGWAWPLLAAAGLWRASRTLRPSDVRWVHAYALAFVLVLALRSVSGVLLKDLKDALFVAPLMALLATIALVRVSARGRLGRWAAAAVAAGLMLHGLAQYWSYLTPRLALVAPG